MQTASAKTGDPGDFLQQIADFVFAGGTVGALYGFEEQELEAVYAHGYTLYNQARWREALEIFSFLSFHDHLDRRFHVARAACLQMLKQHEEALRAYATAHVLDVSEPTVALHIAECFIGMGLKDEARSTLEAVAELTGNKPELASVRTRAAALAALLSQPGES